MSDPLARHPGQEAGVPARPFLLFAPAPGGVRIYEYTPGFLHAKCYVSDDDVAVVGSINMDYRSLFLHFECGTLLFHNSQVSALRDDVLRTLPQCREIHLSDCRTSLPGTLLDSVLRLLSP